MDGATRYDPQIEVNQRDHYEFVSAVKRVLNSNDGKAMLAWMERYCSVNTSSIPADLGQGTLIHMAGIEGRREVFFALQEILNTKLEKPTNDNDLEVADE